MRILVTGGAGYVGSHAVAGLLAEGHEVVVLDNLSTGHPPAVPAGSLVQGDIGDRDLVHRLLAERRIEAVVHFAASCLVGESVRDPARYFRNNVVASLALFDAMRSAGVKQIVFSSSCATYGVPAASPIDEDCPQRPVNPYGWSKLMVERALAEYARAYGWGCCSLRYFNAAGASRDGNLGEDHRQETHLIPLVFRTALGQRPAVEVFGDDYPTPDGTCVRDYVHVEDLAAAHLAALARLRPGQALAFNLGTGRGHSVLEVVAACRQVTDHPLPIAMRPRREGDPAELVAAPTRANQALGWTPQYRELGAIVETAWRWHRAHPRGYDT